jgi:hypothetical protein
MGMSMVSEAMLQEVAGDEWTTDVGGTMICPHGHRIDPDQRNEHPECDCRSPIVEAGMI